MKLERKPRGFSLVELLTVIGVISILIAMLLPSLSRARMQAEMVQCQSNLRQVGQALFIYSGQWDGWMYPPGLGANRPPNERWPVHVFRGVWNPPIMLCPSDFEPVAEHSYILNDHLASNGVGLGKGRLGGKSSSEVVLMGEKRSERNDYYMNVSDFRTDFPTRVELFRHGIRLGSNYLFMDGHVSTQGPEDARQGVDPWEIPITPTEPET